MKSNLVKEINTINLSEGYLAIHRIYSTNNGNKDAAILILCHGITYSSLAVYDIPIDGVSFAEEMAYLGYNVFMPDYLGYGNSYDGKNANVTMDTAVRDVQITIEFIRQSGFKGNIALLGWSWGAQVAGHLATRYEHNEISVLILYGFKWHIDCSKLSNANEMRRVNTADHLKQDFTVLDNISKDVIDTYIDTALKVNPTSPNGPRNELISNKRLAVVPTLINIPTMVIHGNDDEGVDLDDNMKFFSKITCTEKQYITIYGAHALHLEKTYKRFIRVVNNFISTYLNKNI